MASYEPGGKPRWSTGVSSGEERANDVALDASGNIYVAGRFQGTAMFGSVAVTSKGKGDAFVAASVGARGARRA